MNNTYRPNKNTLSMKLSRYPWAADSKGREQRYPDLRVSNKDDQDNQDDQNDQDD